MVGNCGGANLPDNKNNKRGAVVAESDPLALNVRGLVMSWQSFDDDRLLLVAVDMFERPFRYSIQAFQFGRLVAKEDSLTWSHVVRFMHGALQLRDSGEEFWEVAVQRLRAGGQMPK